MSHYMQKFKYPIKYYVMATIQELCNGDEALTFKISDLESLVQEKQPDIGLKQIRAAFSTIISGGGFVERTGPIPLHESGMGRGELSYKITEKGINANPHKLPSSKTLTETRKAQSQTKPKRVIEVVSKGAVADTEEDDLDKTSSDNYLADNASPPNLDEIDDLIKSIDLKDFSQEEISFADMFTQQFLIYIKSKHEEINKMVRSLEHAERRHKEVIHSYKSELKTKEKQMAQLNERLTKMSSIIRGYEKHKKNKQTSLGTLGDVFKKTYPSRQ